VPTQLTGTPEFETVVVPDCWAPQGIPRAGRVSMPAAGVVGVGEGGVIVRVLVVAGGDDVLVACVVGAGGGGVLVIGGGVVLAAGAVMVGGGVAVAGAAGACGSVAVAGARGAGGIVVTEDGVSTLVGVSWNPEAERRAMTITNPTSTTTMMVRPNAAVCSRRRRRDVTGVSSVIAPDKAGSDGLTSSPMPASGRTSGGAKAL
jgi:hypothetical protein